MNETNGSQGAADRANSQSGHPAHPADALLARIGETENFAKAFYFKGPGDTLIGEFLRWSKGTTSRGETHPIAEIRDRDGVAYSVWCFYTVLRQQLVDLDLTPGDWLAIRREEDRESAAGHRYRNFKVIALDEGTPAAVSPPVDAAPPPSETPITIGDWALARPDDGVPF